MRNNITASQLPLSAVLASQDDIIFSYPTAKIWNPQGVSLLRRIESDELELRQINRLISANNLEKYIVPADRQAPTRCIDGRLKQGWLPTEDAARLGPKIAGGTAHAALAHRIVDIENLTQDLQFEEDIRAVIKLYKRSGIGFGGHIDDHQRGGNTGCGAIDNIDLILDRLQEPEPQEQLRGLTRLILGDDYDQTVVNEVIGRMLLLDAVKPRYLPKEHNNPNGAFLYKKTIVQTIRREAAAAEEPVPALAGSHQEIAMVLNFVPGTTIDNDRFSYDNENKLQLFGWDVWEMYEEARYLYPLVRQEKITKRRTVSATRLRYVTTRTLLGLATLMVLTDGSLRLATIQS